MEFVGEDGQKVKHESVAIHAPYSSPKTGGIGSTLGC
jgi:hypothetical protein